MSKASKSAAPAEPTFEDALKKLEAIVTEMESADLPLETLLSRYEEGVKLARACQSKLADAELKIQRLEKAADGELTLKPADLPAEES
jgi:exodeoxyribonuclease VII small subunit